MPVEVCYKKTVAFVSIGGIKARGLKTGQGFSRRIHTEQFQNRGSRVRPSRFRRRGRFRPGAQPDPPREKEKQADSSVSDPNTIQVHLSGINKKKSDGQRWRPAKPDAGPVIKSGFYGADPVTESHKVYRYDTKWG